MLRLGTLFYDINADTSNLKKANREVKTTNDSMSRSFKALGGVIATVISIESARRVLKLADNMTMLRGRVRNLTKSQAEFSKVWAETIRISNDVGVSIDGTVSAYQRFAQIKDIIGANSEETLRFTETLQKLGIISGATGQEVAMTSIQIGQALANNFESSAQEINSINEQMPAVARAVEASLNLTAGSFKRAVLDGKVSADQFFRAILEQSEKVDDKFKGLPVTISRAWQTFENEFANSISELNEAEGITSSIAKSILNASDYVKKNMNPAFDETKSLLDDIEARVDFMTKGMTGFESSGVDANGVLFALSQSAKAIGDALINLPINLTSAMAILISEFNQLLINMELFWRGDVSFVPEWMKEYGVFLNEAGIAFSKTASEKAKLAQQNKKDLDEIIKLEAKYWLTGNVAHEAELQRLRDRVKTRSETTKNISQIMKDERATEKKSLQDALKFEQEAISAYLAANKKKMETLKTYGEKIRADRKESRRIAKARMQDPVEGDADFIGAVQPKEDEKEAKKQDRFFTHEEKGASDFDLMMASLGDQTLAIENAYKERAEKIAKIGDKSLEDSLDRYLMDEANEKKYLADKKKLQDKAYSDNLSALTSSTDQLMNAMREAGAEETAIGKALFLAQQGLRVATIIANTQTAASAHELAGNPVLAEFTRQTGYVSAGIVAALAVDKTFSSSEPKDISATGGGRVSGGQVNRDAIHPINENGEPEVLVQGAKQYLLTGNKSGNVVAGKDMRMGGSSQNLTIINQGAPLEIVGKQVTRDEVIIMVKNAEKSAVNTVNSSLASGRGDSSAALNQGFKVSRNM